MIREKSMEAVKAYKSGESADIDLLDRLKQTATFANVDLESAMNASDYVGRSGQQVDEFIATEVEPIRKRYPQLLSQMAELHV